MAYRAPVIGGTADVDFVVAGFDSLIKVPIMTLPAAFELTRRFAVCDYSLEVSGTVRHQIPPNGTFTKKSKTQSWYGYPLFDEEDVTRTPDNVEEFVYYNQIQIDWTFHPISGDPTTGSGTYTKDKLTGVETTTGDIGPGYTHAYANGSGTTHTDDTEGGITPYYHYTATLIGVSWTATEAMTTFAALAWTDDGGAYDFPSLKLLENLNPYFITLSAESYDGAWNNSELDPAPFSTVYTLTGEPRVYYQYEHDPASMFDFEPVSEDYSATISGINTATFPSVNLDWQSSGATGYSYENLRLDGVWTRIIEWRETGLVFDVSWATTGSVTFPSTFQDAITGAYYIALYGNQVGNFPVQLSYFSDPSIPVDSSFVFGGFIRPVELDSLTSDQLAIVQYLPASGPEWASVAAMEVFGIETFIIAFGIPTSAGIVFPGSGFGGRETGAVIADKATCGAWTLKCSGSQNTISLSGDLLSSTIDFSNLWPNMPSWPAASVEVVLSNPWLDPAAADLLHTAF